MVEASTPPSPYGAPLWELERGGRIAVGSETHKELFCRVLLGTFDPYKPATIDWPELSGDELERRCQSKSA